MPARCGTSGQEDALALGPMLGQRDVRQVPGLASMRQVIAGERHSRPLSADGTAWAWGSNGCGQLSTGAATVGSANAPHCSRYRAWKTWRRLPLTQQGRRVCGLGNNGNLQLDGVAGADANAATPRCIDLP